MKYRKEWPQVTQNCQHLCSSITACTKRQQNISSISAVPKVLLLPVFAYLPRPRDSSQDEISSGRLAEPNVFPWYTIIFQNIDNSFNSPCYPFLFQDATLLSRRIKCSRNRVYMPMRSHTYHQPPRSKRFPLRELCVCIARLFKR